MLKHVFCKVDLSSSLREVPKYTDLSLSDTISNKFYMDNFSNEKSFSNENNLILLSSLLIKTLNSCGFKLTKFIG